MMTAVGQKADFSGAKRSGNTPAVLPQRATPKINLLSTAPWGCGGNRPEAALALRLQPARGCARKAALPAVHSYRNSLVAIKSALPSNS